MYELVSVKLLYNKLLTDHECLISKNTQAQAKILG